MTTSTKYPQAPITTTSSIDYETIYQQALGGVEDPWIELAYGTDRKFFWSNFALDFYGSKPTTIINGQVVHLPDPDLVPQD